MTKSAWSSALLSARLPVQKTASSTSERTFSLIWVSSASHLVGVYLAKVFKTTAVCIQMRSNSCQAEHKRRRDFERPLRISLSRFSAGQTAWFKTSFSSFSAGDSVNGRPLKSWRAEISWNVSITWWTSSKSSEMQTVHVSIIVVCE